MDSDDEEEQMFAELFEEEMAAVAQDEEHLLILACLSGLYAEKAIGTEIYLNLSPEDAIREFLNKW